MCDGIKYSKVSKEVRKLWGLKVKGYFNVRLSSFFAFHENLQANVRANPENLIMRGILIDFEESFFKRES